MPSLDTTSNIKTGNTLAISDTTRRQHQIECICRTIRVCWWQEIREQLLSTLVMISILVDLSVSEIDLPSSLTQSSPARIEQSNPLLSFHLFHRKSMFLANIIYGRHFFVSVPVFFYIIATDYSNRNSNRKLNRTVHQFLFSSPQKHPLTFNNVVERWLCRTPVLAILQRQQFGPRCTNPQGRRQI